MIVFSDGIDVFCDNVDLIYDISDMFVKGNDINYSIFKLVFTHLEFSFS